jgi:hypothetical protein
VSTAPPTRPASSGSLTSSRTSSSSARDAPRGGVRLPAGGWADVSPELEAEAWEQAGRAVAGEPARPGAARSTPAATAAILQGAFTVSATVESGGEEGDRAATDLVIEGVQMTEKKRPPTSLDKSQGRHTVAWEAKTRYWAALLTGKNYRQAIDLLTQLAADEAVDAALGAADKAQKLRAFLLSKLDGLDSSMRLEESAWIQKLTWAVTTYVKTYQLSTAAAFASKKPTGRGEATALKELGGVAEQVR